jgi:hypothetical protein
METRPEVHIKLYEIASFQNAHTLRELHLYLSFVTRIKLENSRKKGREGKGVMKKGRKEERNQTKRNILYRF